MDVIEKAIRAAFEKGDASNREFRERVYRQAFAALDRALQGNPGVTVETAMARRKRLQAQIVEIEKKYLQPEAPGPEASGDGLEAPLPPLTPDEPVAARPVQPPPAADQHEHWREPPPRPRRERVEPEFGGAEPGPAVDAVDGGAREPLGSDGFPRRRKGRRFVRWFIILTALCMLALGLLWAAQTGMFRPAEPIGPAGTVEPETDSFEPGQDEPPVPAATPSDDRAWIPVFRPSDMEAISAPSDASIELMNDDAGDFVRVKSGASGSSVMFDVGQGVLSQLAGKKATFDIIARAEDGKNTQMSVLCNFGELGDCGRKRYAVGGARGDFLFELTLPAKTPGAGGTIAINSDFDNDGKAVDIFEIRVSAE